MDEIWRKTRDTERERASEKTTKMQIIDVIIFCIFNQINFDLFDLLDIHLVRYVCFDYDVNGDSLSAKHNGKKNAAHLLTKQPVEETKKNSQIRRITCFFEYSFVAEAYRQAETIGILKKTMDVNTKPDISLESINSVLSKQRHIWNVPKK